MASSWNNPKLSNRITTDIPSIQELLIAAISMTPEGTDLTPITDVPTNAKRLANSITTDFDDLNKVRFEFFDGSSWKSIGKLMHNVDMLDGFHASKTDTSEGIIPVYDASGKIKGGATGEADTAAKLTTARNIDLGGVVEATAQNFDGSANITIPINHITVQNETDDALIGIVSKAHGGTGNSKGHASDIIVTDTNGGTILASEYGQIGSAKVIRDVDRKSLVIPGNYISSTITTTLNFPYSYSGVAHIQVTKSGNTIFQKILIGRESVWVDTSTDNGASWIGLKPVGGIKDNLTLYISKSGSDTNTGFSSSLPLASINRAVEIASVLVPANGKVKFNMGEGNWGDINIHVPFALTIAPFDGLTALEFIDSLPQFGSISSSHSNCTFTGCVSASLFANQRSSIQLRGYFKTNQLKVTSSATLTLEPDLKLDLVSGSASSAFFIDSARMIFSKGVKCTALEVISYEYFLKTEPSAALVFWNDTLFSGTINATKFFIAPSTNIITVGDIADWNTFLPGTISGTIQNGTIINGVPFGTGEGNKFLAADHKWKAINPATTSSIGLISVGTGLEVTEAGLVSVSQDLQNDLSQKVDSDLSNISKDNLLALTGLGIHGIFTTTDSYTISKCIDFCTRTTSVSWSDGEIVESKDPNWKAGYVILLKIQCSDGGTFMSLQKVLSRTTVQPLSVYWASSNKSIPSLVGTIVARPSPTYDGALLCNGAFVDKTLYSNLYFFSKGKPWFSETGSTFTIPDFRGLVLQSAGGNGIEVGIKKGAGLPDIKGRVRCHADGAIAQNEATGVFSCPRLGGRNIDTGGGNNYGGLDFTASRYNADTTLYGKSSTVQPPAFGMNYFIVY